MNTFDGCCGSCINMNTNDYVRTKDHCYCTERRQYYDLTEPKCRYYRYDPNKDYYDLNRRWHVVSAIFNKLELSDSYECISLLHNFRVNFLEKDEQFNEMLAKYDVIGPVIARCITEDSDSKELCKKLVQTFLVRVLDLIRDNKNMEALNVYLEMINTLKTFYADQINEYLEIKKIK